MNLSLALAPAAARGEEAQDVAAPTTCVVSGKQVRRLHYCGQHAHLEKDAPTPLPLYRRAPTAAPSHPPAAARRWTSSFDSRLRASHATHSWIWPSHIYIYILPQWSFVHTYTDLLLSSTLSLNNAVICLLGIKLTTWQYGLRPSGVSSRRCDQYM